MSNNVFPTLPGLQWDCVKVPTWKTIVHESVSGRETRASMMQYPTWKFELKYEFLRSATAYQELQSLVGLFNICRGSWDSFLYKDPNDYSIANQNIGIGDGVETDFQLVRNYAGFIEPVMNPLSNVVIKVDADVMTTPQDYLIGSTGIVSFTTPPDTGSVISWTGEYYHRCRFEKDDMEFTLFMKDLWSAKKVAFIGSVMNKV